jgi:hypothetical protein
MINSGLGFQLASTNVIVPTSSYIRCYVLFGVLVSIWLSLVVYDKFRVGWPKAATNGRANGALTRYK